MSDTLNYPPSSIRYSRAAKGTSIYAMGLTQRPHIFLLIFPGPFQDVFDKTQTRSDEESEENRCFKMDKITTPYFYDDKKKKKAF